MHHLTTLGFYLKDHILHDDFNRCINLLILANDLSAEMISYINENNTLKLNFVFSETAHINNFIDFIEDCNSSYSQKISIENISHKVSVNIPFRRWETSEDYLKDPSSLKLYLGILCYYIDNPLRNSDIKKLICVLEAAASSNAIMENYNANCNDKNFFYTLELFFDDLACMHHFIVQLGNINSLY